MCDWYAINQPPVGGNTLASWGWSRWLKAMTLKYTRPVHSILRRSRQVTRCPRQSGHRGTRGRSWYRPYRYENTHPKPGAAIRRQAATAYSMVCLSLRRERLTGFRARAMSHVNGHAAEAAVDARRARCLGQSIAMKPGCLVENKTTWGNDEKHNFCRRVDLRMRDGGV